MPDSTFEDKIAVTLPSSPDLSSHATKTAANWGTVYQNYISTNLSAEELAKGAYDAYNLLTAGALKEFQTKVSSAIETLDDNQASLFEKVGSESRRIDFITQGLGYLFVGEESGKTPDQQPIIKSDKSIYFWSNDDSSSRTDYNMSQSVEIPIAGENTDKQGARYYRPGLIKGKPSVQLNQIIPHFIQKRKNFDTVYSQKASYVNTSLSEGFPTSMYTPSTQEEKKFKGTANLTRMGLLVWKVNCLQHQVNQLSQFINRLIDGDIKLKKLSVKYIDIIPSNETIGDFAFEKDTYYLKPALFNITTV